MALVIALLIPCVAFGQVKDQPGRWQLFQGEYQFVNIKGEQHWIRALFKLDTATGNLYECKEWQYDGKQHGKEGMLLQKSWCEPFEKEGWYPYQK